MLLKRLRSCLLGSLLAAAALAALATPASAGTYVVHSCGANANRSWTGWSFHGTGGGAYYYSAMNCADYGMYWRLEVWTIPAGTTATWTFQAPADTFINKATFHQTINFRSPGTYDNVIAERADGTRSLVGTVVGTGDDNAVAYDKTYDMPAGANLPVQLHAELGCQSGANCAGTWNGQYANVWTLGGADFELIDPSTPAFSSVGGSGWAAEPTDGTSPITYSIGDAGSGIKEVRYFVDGIQNASNASPCIPGEYVPCPKTANGQFVLDTTRLSEGAHTVSLVALDYAGNTMAQSDKQMTITVRRAPHASGTSPVSTSDPSANGGGSPAVGDQISGNQGSWSGTGNSYTYQWMRCDAQGLNCGPIPGATGINYTATTADLGHTLQFCVTATNSGGSSTSCSLPTLVVIANHPPTSTTNTSDQPGQTPKPSTSGGSSSTPTSVGSGQASVDRGSPNGSPASERVVLSAFTNNRSSTQKVKFGKRVRINGRLLGPNGVPIGSALLSVQTQTLTPGAAMADSSQVVTGRDGRFSYTAPAGPSRVIRFGYRTYTSDTSFADTTDVRLLVAAGVTMKATPTKVRNRHATTFTGRLLGKPIPRRGVVVDLQVFFRKQWRTFATPRTNRKGVYKFRYRFMAGAATWKFRARVRHDSSYPFELGTSARLIKVRVTN